MKSDKTETQNKNMSKKLVIVESPTKAKTIQKFLNNSYQVESSFGHIRDLPKKQLGVNIENNFEPKYIVPIKSSKTVNHLKLLAKNSEETFLATDEDREGEAISWHLNYLLKPKKYSRIVFHEITKQAILEALKNPRQLDENLFNAQQARRILDRLVGYKLSPFLWKKVAKGLSAGRVQSAALRLICEREEEIKKFIKQEYWTIKAKFETDKKENFESELAKIKNKNIEKFDLKTKKQTDDLIQNVKKYEYQVINIETQDKQRHSPPPLTTSTLQQAANNRLNFSSKQTMVIAQQLYEGIKLKEGNIGLITYMRTDSLSLSENFLSAANDFIKQNFGENYSQKKQYKTKSKNAQEAHEAIRPTDVYRTPENIKQYLDLRQYKLYKLIWERAIASQMSPAKIQKTKIIISDKDTNYTFISIGNIIKFDGFLKVYPSKIEENIFPKLEKNESLKIKDIEGEQHFTEPAPKYTEASLVKAMEKLGIGRPSTYAPTISTIITRQYIIKDGKKLQPAEMGKLVNKVLTKYFPKIVDYEFTAEIEEDFDEIARGEKEWQPFLKEFYEPFNKNLEEKYKSVEKINTDEKTNEICDKCGKPMVIKLGRFGKFLACSGFPECKNTKPIVKELGIDCPKCAKGRIIIKKTKRGKIFYGCSEYPKCNFASWQKPTGELCKKCGSPMVESARGKIYCSNKECR